MGGSEMSGGTPGPGRGSCGIGSCGSEMSGSGTGNCPGSDGGTGKFGNDGT
jgi:hypothetical protein